MQQTRLDETAEHSARREELAALRRHLPLGVVVEELNAAADGAAGVGGADGSA